ncbi:MAG: response regulator transcription factor [Cytophagales bacterium]|nr:response regulator transcription factor [Cytophagales bacterium]
MRTYNLLIADDHKMFLDGLSSILEQNENWCVRRTFRSGAELLDFIRRNPEEPVDMVISDISMPVMDGLVLNAEIKKQFPHIKTLFVSMHNDGERIEQAKQDGADGYVLKNAEKEELKLAIRNILEGSKYYSEEAKAALARYKKEDAALSTVRLSKREKEVISLIAQEFTTQEIADRLFLSKHTIESYRKNLMLKLQVKNLAGLTKYAIRTGLAEA